MNIEAARGGAVTWGPERTVVEFPFSFAVITGADHKYYSLLIELLDSLIDCAAGKKIPVCVLDFGLEPAQVGQLESRGVRIAIPDWDIAFPDRAKYGSWYKAITARPFLAKHFPGFDVYLWIDSDIWVQDLSAIELYLSVAWSGRLAVTSQIDRSYQSLYKWQRPRFNTLAFREYRRAYGWRVANRLGRNPLVNSGAFALRADAPHWALWQDALTRGLQRSSSALRDQTALNYVVFNDRPPTGLVPAWCNWICIDGTPMWDETSGLLVEPQPPHRPLGLLHLAGPAKNRTFALRTSSGVTVEETFHYSPWRRRRKEILDRAASA
jgi:hypothetical protein